jgi:PAS domain S-box-containing protein
VITLSLPSSGISGAALRSWAALPAGVRRAGGLLLFALASFGLCRLGLALTPGATSIALFWPASGLVFGALLISDPARWPELLIAAGVPIAVFNALAGQPPVLVTAFGLHNALEAALAAFLVRRLCRGRPQLAQVGHVLVMAAGPVATSGLCALLSAAVVRHVYGQPLGFLWLHLWAGTGLGMIAVGSVVLAWTEPSANRAPWSPRAYLELAALVAALGLVAWLVLDGPGGKPLAYKVLLLPPLVWTALRHGLRGATSLGLLVTLMALAAVVAGTGAFTVPDGPPAQAAVQAQVFCLAVILTALFLASAVEDRQRSAAALRDREEKYRLLVENQTDLVVKVDPDGRFLFVSPSYCRTFGMRESDLLGKQFMPLVHEEDRESTAGAMEALHRPPHAAYVEQRALTAQGWRWFAWADTAVLDETGTVRAIVGVGRDITERRLIEERLRQSEKLEAIGRLAGGVAHDFNNQLAAILGSTEYLTSSLDPDPEIRDTVNTIREAALRSAALTRQLLAFARKDPARATTVDLKRIVEDVVALLVRSIDKRIAVKTDFADAPALTSGDSDRLHAAVLNLALNARDAMPEGGTLTLSTGTVELGPEQSGVLGIAPGGYRKLCVADTGVGLTAEARAHLFEPFFTTKAPGKGSGLGLAEVYGTATAHGGAVEVTSVPGRGTTVSLLLPPAKVGAPESRPGAGVAPAHAAPRPRLRVLVVDDERNVRRSLTMLLRASGHDVVECDGGREAVRSRAAEHGSVDLAIVDMVMPEITGREVVAELRKGTPALPIIVSSGFSAGNEVEALLSEPGVFLLQKPYTSDQLQRTVLAAVQGASSPSPSRTSVSS